MGGLAKQRGKSRAVIKIFWFDAAGAKEPQMPMKISSKSCNSMRRNVRKAFMTYKELDFLFPFFVLAYGALMTFTLNSPRLMRLAEERFPQTLVQQMNMHRGLGLLSLFLGAAWSLQNLWFSTAG